MKNIKKLVSAVLITFVTSLVMPSILTYAYPDKVNNEQGEGGIQRAISDSTAPSMPKDLQCVYKNATSIVVIWTKSTDNSDSKLKYLINYENKKTGEEKTMELYDASRACIEDLDYNTEYKITVTAKNSEGAVSKEAEISCKTNEPGFLVIAAESLYRTNEQSFISAMNTYEKDLNNYGLNPVILKVSNKREGDGIHKCSTAQQLKDLIKDAYNNGCKGFVLVGSAPDIPVVNWELGADSKDSCPTDLYYADMDGQWVDRDNDGKFDNYEKESLADGSIVYRPEMYYGRIDSKGYSFFINQEAKDIAKYLNKVHMYKINGGNLPDDIRNKALIFNDSDSFKDKKLSTSMSDSPVSNFSKAFKEVYGVFDENETDAKSLLNRLEEGYTFINLAIHSSVREHCLHRYNDGSYVNDLLTLDDLTKISPKFNFINLYCCSACRYDVDGVVQNNLGEVYLFNNDYALNVTGSTGVWGPWLNKDFYETVYSGKPIGEAFKNYLATYHTDKDSYEECLKDGVNAANISEDVVKGVLLGDPTLDYYVRKRAIETPYITTNLAGSGIEEANKMANIGEMTEIARTNYNYRDVFYDVKGLPENQIVRLGGNVYWKPSASEAGNTYRCTITAYNKDDNGNPINKYEETFSITAVAN